MIRSLMVGSLLFLALRSTGCDVCGIFLNVQPNDRSTQFGVLYRARTLSRDFRIPGISLLKHGGTVAPEEQHQVRELMTAAELRADIRLAERWALLAAVPMVNTYQSVNGYLRYDEYGAGDPFAILRYQVVNTKRTSSDTTAGLVHRLLLGGGLKLPFGRTDVTYQSERLHPDAQPGTGSWDALLSLEYAMRGPRNGLLFTTLGRINTPDTYGVRLGHTVSNSLELFRNFRMGGAMQVLPSVGGYVEWAGFDDLKGAVQEQTGGTTWFTTAGVRAYWRNWMLTASYQKALSWNIGDEMTATDHRLVAGLSYLLKNN